MKVIGVEMNNHSDKRATSVPKGTAADDPFAHSKMLVKKNTENRIL